MAETFKVYLDSCATKFESVKRCSSLSVVIKRSRENFFFFFFSYSEKVKFPRYKYAVLQVRWHEYVREVSKSEEVQDSCKGSDTVRSIVSCYLECNKRHSLQYAMEALRNGRAKCLSLSIIRIRQKIRFLY